ncbi:MAG: dynamin family protein [Chromatiales bacterium]|nr:dynamin family protein [Chromatiales bacterium]
MIDDRLNLLESHLKEENPVLLDAVRGFRQLDRIAHRMGLLAADQSYATQISWWPLIAILGTFSAGKSSFINYFLDTNLQRTGNQAVDDKFTVLCFSREPTPHALPGVALDADPRFPLYRISAEIDRVAAGEGKRIDSYLQMKTCPSEELRGRILVDSPGFDADAQRTATLRITDHIVALADLVLVFFDARHPEPGAMHDTLHHLVGATLKRPDSSKFLYILNQIDTAAREDNPEDVVAAWQRALAEQGLTAGRFYTIYNPKVAQPIDDPALRRRFETKRDLDLGEIIGRMRQVTIERAYRIVASLEKTARDLDAHAAPAIDRLIDRWRRRVLVGDAIVAGLVAVGVGVAAWKFGWWTNGALAIPGIDWLRGHPGRIYAALAVAAALAIAVHFVVRSVAAAGIARSLARTRPPADVPGNLKSAFIRNTRPWRSIFARKPAGWGRFARKRVLAVLAETDRFVQRLNDRFTDPSGRRDAAAGPNAVEVEAVAAATADAPAQPSPAPASSS